MNEVSRQKCVFCGKTVRIKNDGGFYLHKFANRYCFGSKQTPGTVTIGLSGPEEAIAVCMRCGTVKSGRLRALNGKQFFDDHMHADMQEPS